MAKRLSVYFSANTRLGIFHLCIRQSNGVYQHVGDQNPRVGLESSIREGYFKDATSGEAVDATATNKPSRLQRGSFACSNLIVANKINERETQTPTLIELARERQSHGLNPKPFKISIGGFPLE